MRRAVLAILLASLPTPQLAQAHPAGGVCGSPLIQEPSAAEKSARTAGWQRDPTATHQVGDREELWVYNYDTRQNEEVGFTYRAVNEHSAVLVADGWWSATDPQLVGPADVTRVTEVFEHRSGPAPGVGKGIYQLLTDAYAPVTPICLQTDDGPICDDGMVYIALCEIKSDLPQGYVVGYVALRDRYVGLVRSNERNMVTIDIARTPLRNVEETLAHEFQHVIHSGIDEDEARWVDEGIAVYSQVLCGYDGNSGSEFFKNTGIGLFDGGDLPTIADYDKSYLLMQYMVDRFGVSLLGQVLRSPARGTSGVDAALAAEGRGERFTEDVLPAWAVANLSKPGADPICSYATYDPTAHHPPDFGDAGPLPISTSGSLPPSGLRYVDASAGGAAAPAHGDATVQEGSVWLVSSVVYEDDRPKVVRPWYGPSSSTRRDCSLDSPWLIVGPTTASGSYSLAWEELAADPNPVIVDRQPMGDEVSPYGARISASLANVDPEWPISVSVLSQSLGNLLRDVRVEREGLLGRCAETVAIVDYSAELLPPSDLITVVLSDVGSPFGGVLPSSEVTWQFRTEGADTQPPTVTLGLLANPVLPGYVTAVALSDEPLYPDGDGPVRLAMGDAPAVDLEKQDAVGKRWLGRVVLSATGTYGFSVKGTDVAGNPVPDQHATYAVVVAGDWAAARVASARKEAER